MRPRRYGQETIIAAMRLVAPLVVCALASIIGFAPIATHAQTTLLGTRGTTAEVVGYSVSKGNSLTELVYSESVLASRRNAHLLGDFIAGGKKDLLRARRTGPDLFVFSVTTAKGENISRRVRLSRAVGKRFYLMTGFDIGGDGSDDVAIVDVSERQYRWFIIENPVEESARERLTFQLGYQGDRIEWTKTARRELEFAAIRQSKNGEQIRAILRGAESGDTRVFRARWRRPEGALIPIRLRSTYRYDPSLALYSPAKKSLLLFSANGGGLISLSMPRQRCGGYQVVSGVTLSGDVSALELCSDGTYVAASRANQRASQEDSVVSSGSLAAPIANLRRGDLTRIYESVGEVSLPIPEPGSDGSVVFNPIVEPQPGTLPDPSPTPSPTPTPTNTPTPTATPIPTPLVFTIDTTQTSTGSTTTTQFKLPLIPGGQYNFTAHWGDGTQSVVTSYDDPDATHTYSSAGEYTVSVYGQLYGWRFDNAGDRLKLSDISQWGNMFRFAPGAGETASKFALNAGEEQLEALVSHGGYIWAAAATSPSKIIRFNPNDNSHTTTTLESDETQVYGLTTDGAYLYAVDWDASSRIIRVDPATGARVAGYETGVDRLFTVTFDGTYIWAASFAATVHKLVRFNPTDTSMTVYDLPGTEGAWTIISVGEHIFGVNNTTLFKFNKASQQITTATITGTNQVEGLTYDGTNIWGITETNPAKILKFNPDTLTYETFTAPTGANGAEGMIFDGTNLWATLKSAEVAALLKIPPTNASAATIVPLSFTSARVNAITHDGNKIWAGDWESPASLYSISKSFWPSEGFFYGCSNMTVSATDAPDMTGVTSMRNAFRDTTEFNSDIGNWDVSNVTDFSRTFRGATSFNNGGGLAVTAYDPYPANLGARIWLSSGVYNGVKLKAITISDTPFVYFSHGQSLVDSVSNSSGTIKIAYGADFPNLTKVRFTTTGALPGGLSTGVDYWIIRQASNNPSTDIRPAGIIASSLANAQAGVGIAYSNAGTGTHTITAADGTVWMEGPATSQHWFKHYDDGTTMRPVAAGNWSVWWLYRELSSTSKKVFYVSGPNQYATQAEAAAVPERTDLPATITGNSVLVAKLLLPRQNNSDNLRIVNPEVVRLIDGDGYYGGSDSIKNWNVSSAKTFYGTFASAQSFDLPLQWNPSRATDFSYMFSNARSFNQYLSGWDVSSGTNFYGMFSGASAFNNGDSGNNGLKPLTWVLAKGEVFADMFNCAFKFNQDVSSWDMRSALNIDAMFAYGLLFNNGDPTNAQSKPLSWYLPKVTRANYVFYEQSPFNQDISSWFTPRNGDVMQVTGLQTAICTRQGSSEFKLFNNGGSPSINNWRTPLATDISGIFSRCSLFNQPINDWDVSSVTNFTLVFYGATAFNQPLNNWNVAKGTNMATMFFSAPAFNQDLSSWNTSNVTTMSSMFSGATNFNNGDTGNNSAKPLPWNVAKVTTFASMFTNATAFNQDISNWNVSAATTLASMFSGASAFNSYIGTWSPSSATTFASMFLNAAAFNNGDPAGASSKPLAWTNTGLVTTMSSMFSGARRFNQNLSSFNTANVTSLASTFANASSFNQDISGWDISKVTSLNATFSGAVSLKRDLSNWNPTLVTDFTNMLATSDVNTPGTTDNYDNLLLKLATVTTQNTRSLSGGSARYSYTGLGDATAGTGRAHLTTATSATPTAGHGWTISDGGTTTCTFSSSSGLLVTYTGDRPTFSRIVFKSNGTLPTGIMAGTTYWTVRVSATTARLATSLANAQGNTIISYTDSGSGTHAVMNRGHVFTASNSSGSLLLSLTTGGDLNFSGRKVRFETSGTLPTGISAGVDYFLNRVSATTYRVTSGVIDAATGVNFITFTDSGSGTHELVLQ